MSITPDGVTEPSSLLDWAGPDRAGSDTPPGCSFNRRGFPVVVLGHEGTTTGYHLATLRVGFRFSPQNVQTSAAGTGVPALP